MEEAAKAMRGKKFVMLSVSIDAEGEKAVRTFLEKTVRLEKPSFQILLDPEGKVSKQYGTFKVPETYVIDSAGRIRDKAEGIRDWSDSLFLHYFQLLARSN